MMLIVLHGLLIIGMKKMITGILIKKLPDGYFSLRNGLDMIGNVTTMMQGNYYWNLAKEKILIKEIYQYEIMANKNFVCGDEILEEARRCERVKAYDKIIDRGMEFI